jgi:hypothetical protein
MESLILYQGRQVVRQVRPPEFDKLEASPYLRIFWEGARIRGRARRAVWDGEITIQGAEIVSAQTFAFDSPADGILETNPHRVRFLSRTVGDRDGITLCLDQARKGRLHFYHAHRIIQRRAKLAVLTNAPSITAAWDLRPESTLSEKLSAFT